MSGVYLNALSTAIIVVSYAFVALVYYALRKTTTSGVARDLFGFLSLAWALFTVTYILALSRIFVYSIELNILIYRIDVIFSAMGLFFLFLFLGKLYESQGVWRIHVVVGLVVMAIIVALYALYPGFSAVETEYGYEVTLSPEVQVSVLVGIIIVIISFLGLIIHTLRTVSQVEKRRRVVNVSLLYILWLIFTVVEAGGILVEILGGFGMFITRVVLSLLAIGIIYTWAGKQRISEALGSLGGR